jgi:hypothetical protein
MLHGAHVAIPHLHSFALTPGVSPGVPPPRDGNYVLGVPPPATETTFYKPKGASPHKKDHPGTPAVRLDRRSVKGKYRRRIIHTQAQPKHNPAVTHTKSSVNPPSIITLYASPVKSYGGCAGVMFLWGEAPFGL